MWAYVWVVRLHRPCCLGGPQHFRAVAKSEVGPHVNGLATSRLPSWVSPTLQSGGQNQKWAHMWTDWLHHAYRLGCSQRLRAGDNSTHTH